MPHSYFVCDLCEKRIPYGSAYVCINKNIEQYDIDTVDDDIQVDVIHSEALVTMCGRCGNSFNDELLKKLILLTPNLKNTRLN